MRLLTCDDLVAWFQSSEDDIERSHSTCHYERMLSVGDLGNVVFCTSKGDGSQIHHYPSVTRSQQRRGIGRQGGLQLRYMQ